MTKSKNKHEFETEWKAQFKTLHALAMSLPNEHGVALNFLKELNELSRYIEIAAKYCFGGTASESC